MSKKIKISLENPEVRRIWEAALDARREVASWPAWKRGDDEAPASGETPPSTSAAPKVEPEH